MNWMNGSGSLTGSAGGRPGAAGPPPPGAPPLPPPRARDRFGASGELKREAVAAADGPGRRRPDLACQLGLLVRLPLRLVPPVLERGVDPHDDLVVGMLGAERPHRLVELRERRQCAAFG